MATYAQIKKQIAQLQQQADKVREAELAKVISQVRETIATYGLTAEEVGLSGSRGAAGKTAKQPKRGKRSVKGAGVPKYQDPKTGKTWTGFGKPPLWISGAKDREAFRINGSPTLELPAAPMAKSDAAVKSKATAKKAGKRAVSKPAQAKRGKATKAAATKSSRKSAAKKASAASPATVQVAQAS